MFANVQVQDAQIVNVRIPDQQVKIDGAAAHQKGRQAEGEAMAKVISDMICADGKAEAKRKGSRIHLLAKLAAMDADAHTFFRAELGRERDALNQWGDKTEGTTVASMRVQYSVWNTLSQGIQAGVSIVDDNNVQLSFDEVLTMCRIVKQADASMAKDGAKGTRKAGGGRKAKGKGVTLAQVVQLAEQLSTEDKAKLMEFLQAAIAE